MIVERRERGSKAAFLENLASSQNGGLAESQCPSYLSNSQSLYKTFVMKKIQSVIQGKHDYQHYDQEIQVQRQVGRLEGLLGVIVKRNLLNVVYKIKIFPNPKLKIYFEKRHRQLANQIIKTVKGMGRVKTIRRCKSQMFLNQGV